MTWNVRKWRYSLLIIFSVKKLKTFFLRSKALKTVEIKSLPLGQFWKTVLKLTCAQKRGFWACWIANFHFLPFFLVMKFKLSWESEVMFQKLLCQVYKEVFLSFYLILLGFFRVFHMFRLFHVNVKLQLV